MTEQIITELTEKIDLLSQQINLYEAIKKVLIDTSHIDSHPKYTDERLMCEFKAACFLTQKEDGSIDEIRFCRAFANRILMQWGEKEALFKAMVEASKLHIKNSMSLWQVDAYGNEWTYTYFIRSKDKSNAINAVRQKYYDNDDNVQFGAEIVNDDENNIFGE